MNLVADPSRHTEQVRNATRTLSVGAALGRAVTAAALMGVALAVASHLGMVAGVSASPSHPLGVRVAVAAPVALVVVAGILLLRSRWDRGSLAGIGMTGARADLRGFVLGAGVVSTAGAVILAVLSVVGAAHWSSFEPPRLAAFLLTNAVVALLLEAIPEEVSIRGYALTALKARFPRPVATVLNITTFLLVPIAALGTQFLLGQLAGGESVGFSAAPGGEDALTYYLMLAAFGLLLVYAREATTKATVWTCIGAHLGWLSVNRIVLGGAAGVEVELLPSATMVFFGTYVTVAVVSFSLLRDRADRRRTG